MTATLGTGWKPRRRTVLASAAAMLCVASASAVVAGSDLVDLRVIDRETGRVMPTYSHGGRLYVAGAPGARYGLRVRNRTGGRVLVVMSVDGVNIVTGQTADYGQNGYVLDPWSGYDLNGWRKSSEEIAAFEFAPLPQSYAARTGRPDDVGVIGMAVFKEKVAFHPPVYGAPPTLWNRRGDADRPAGVDALAKAAPPRRPMDQPPPSAAAGRDAAGSASAYAQSESAPLDEKLGTAHGAREWSVSETTTFERATSYPQSVRLIQYDTYENLAAAGVAPWRWQPPRRPRPFPGAPEPNGYVPDPPG